MRFNAIMRNLNLLNAVLLTAAAVFAVYVLSPLFNAQAKYTLPSPKKVEEVKDKGLPGPEFPQSQEYMVVAERNIFHPERKIPMVKIEAPPLPKPEFVLYGTLLSGDTKLAFIDDSKSSPTKGKRQRALHLGSSLSGFTLKEVYQDRVVMERGAERLEVKVLDSAKSRVAGSAAASGGRGPERAASSPKAPSVKQPQAQPPARGEQSVGISKPRVRPGSARDIIPR